jgi:transposase
MAFDFGRETRSLEELEAKLEAGQLGDQEKNFIRHYVTTGDQIFAHTHAYESKNHRKDSYAVMLKKSIRDIIDWFLKKSDKELFLEELERACRSRKITPTKLKLFELRAATEFGIDLKTLRAEAAKSKKTEADQEGQSADVKDPNRVWKVGEKTTYQGRPVVVTGIDASGKVTDVEWVTP